MALVLYIRVGEGILVGEAGLGFGDPTLELLDKDGEGGSTVLTATSMDCTGDAGGLSRYEACRRFGEGDEGGEDASADKDRVCKGILIDTETGFGDRLTTLRIGDAGDVARAETDGERLTITLFEGADGESGLLEDEVAGDSGRCEVEELRI